MWSLFGESVIHHQFKSMVVHWDSVKMNYVVVNSYAFRMQLLFMKTNDWILTSCHKQCIFFLQPSLCPEGLQDRGWTSQYSLAILYFSHNSFIVPYKMLSHISLKILQAKLGICTRLLIFPGKIIIYLLNSTNSFKGYITES